MIALDRETVAVLTAAAQAVLPGLVVIGHPATWDLSCALNAAESALLEDEREDESDSSTEGLDISHQAV